MLTSRTVTATMAKSKRTGRPQRASKNGLQVFCNAKTKATTFNYRYTSPLTGSSTKLAFRAVSLDRAKELAAAAQLEIAEGLCPSLTHAKTTMRAGGNRAGALTVADAVELYFELKSHDIKKPTKRSLQALQTRLRVQFRDVVGGNKPLVTVSADQIRHCLALKNSTAGAKSNLYKAIRTFFERMKIEGKLVDARGKMLHNPVELVRKPEIPAKRKRTLTDAEIKLFWRATDNIGLGGMAFRLSLLTGARISEVIGMTTDEISFRESMWTIPAERSKNGKEHKVYLADLSIATIRATISNYGFIGCKYVFTSDGKAPFLNYQNSKDALDKLMIEMEHGTGPLTHAMAKVWKRENKRIYKPWTVHDLRRTFATGQQAIGTDTVVTEKLLNHALPALLATYQQQPMLPQRMKALDNWSFYLQAFLAGDRNHLVDEDTTRAREIIGERREAVSMV